MLGSIQRLILEQYDSVVPGTDIRVELKTGYDHSRGQADLAAANAPDLLLTGGGLRQYQIHWFLSLGTMTMLPVLVIYLVLQRHFVSGVVTSGIKG